MFCFDFLSWWLLVASKTSVYCVKITVVNVCIQIAIRFINMTSLLTYTSCRRGIIRIGRLKVQSFQLLLEGEVVHGLDRVVKFAFFDFKINGLLALMAARTGRGHDGLGLES